MFQEGKLPKVLIFIDSPIALKLYRSLIKKHTEYFFNQENPEADILKSGKIF